MSFALRFLFPKNVAIFFHANEISFVYIRYRGWREAGNRSLQNMPNQIRFTSIRVCTLHIPRCWELVMRNYDIAVWYFPSLVYLISALCTTFPHTDSIPISLSLIWYFKKCFRLRLRFTFGIGLDWDSPLFSFSYERLISITYFTTKFFGHPLKSFNF